jgi:hypothetical protein
MCCFRGMWCSEGRWKNGSHSQVAYYCFGAVERLVSPSSVRTYVEDAFQSDSGMLSLGETGELSPNASAMLRISTLSAWAQLQVSSIQQGYLENVVQPYRSTLSSLWIASLRDYASIHVDSESLHDYSSLALDSSYSSLGKEVLLPVRNTFFSEFTDVR